MKVITGFECFITYKKAIPRCKYKLKHKEAYLTERRSIN